MLNKFFNMLNINSKFFDYNFYVMLTFNNMLNKTNNMLTFILIFS